MTEKKLADIYWKIALVFAFLSPIAVFHHVLTPLSFKMHTILAYAVPLSAIPLAILLGALLIVLNGGKVRFWIVNPSENVSHTFQAEPNVAFNTLLQRLQEFGFRFGYSQTDEKTLQFAFDKPKAHSTTTFLDHAFQGRIDLVNHRPGIEIRLGITLRETLLLDSGEVEQLRSLGRYLSLEADAYNVRKIPFLIQCGAVMSFSTVLLGCLGFITPAVDVLIPYTSFGAGGYLLASPFYLIGKRAGALGTGLIPVGLYLAAVPLFAWLIRSFS